MSPASSLGLQSPLRGRIRLPRLRSGKGPLTARIASTLQVADVRKAVEEGRARELEMAKKEWQAAHEVRTTADHDAAHGKQAADRASIEAEATARVAEARAAVEGRLSSEVGDLMAPARVLYGRDAPPSHSLCGCGRCPCVWPVCVAQVSAARSACEAEKEAAVAEVRRAAQEECSAAVEAARQAARADADAALAAAGERHAAELRAALAEAREQMIHAHRAEIDETRRKAAEERDAAQTRAAEAMTAALHKAAAEAAEMAELARSKAINEYKDQFDIERDEVVRGLREAQAAQADVAILELRAEMARESEAVRTGSRRRPRPPPLCPPHAIPHVRKPFTPSFTYSFTPSFTPSFIPSFGCEKRRACTFLHLPTPSYTFLHLPTPSATLRCEKRRAWLWRSCVRGPTRLWRARPRRHAQRRRRPPGWLATPLPPKQSSSVRWRCCGRNWRSACTRNSRRSARQGRRHASPRSKLREPPSR